MTEDQYSQARGSGYVVRGDVVPEDETEEARTDESKPMTRFQKVASTLRGGGSEQDEQDQGAAQQRDYWDDPDAAAGHEDDAVAVTSPDTPPDHQATEPDMFGTAKRTGEEPAMPAAEGQPGAATIADVPAARTPVGEAPVGSAPAARDNGGLRPGEATRTLGDFSDLTYGNLIPDAAHYTGQWQQVQFKFVDDPHASVTEAADIIAQVTAKMEAAIAERQRAIEERQRAIAEQQRSLRGRWGAGTNADTEALRETLRMYKTFLDQLIGPRASDIS